MQTLRVTVRNYRCFEDSAAAAFDLREGFTAFVGQNNSGKSSVLKLFYELRSLWSVLGETGNFINLLRGNAEGINCIGVLDPMEIFSDANDRPLQLEFELAAPSGEQVPLPLSKLLLTSRRDRPGYWSGEFFWGAARSATKQIVEPTELSFGPNSVLHKPGVNVLSPGNLFAWSRAFRESMYIGPFRNAINEGAAQYFDISVGSGFVAAWHSWKAGDNKAQNRAVQRVTEDIKHIFGFKTLEIHAATSMKTLQLVVNGRPYKLHELGAGISQFVIVLANAMIRRPSLIFIDEPELNLHPSLQIDFLTTLTSYANQGVVFATHSLGLARSSADRIITFQRSGDEVKLVPFEQTPNYVEFLGEMSFAAFKDMGCDRVLLVEGVHDVRTLHQFLRKLGKDHQTVVLPLGGDQLAKGGVELELAELRRLSSNISVLVDSERQSEGGAPLRARADFARTCQKLGFDVCVTVRRSIENYLSERAVKQVKGQKYSALRPYQSLGDVSPGWGKAENWKIAREMELDEIRGTDLCEFLERI